MFFCSEENFTSIVNINAEEVKKFCKNEYNPQIHVIKIILDGYGNLFKITSYIDLQIKDIPFQRDKYWRLMDNPNKQWIYFYKNGNPRSGVLSQNATIQNIPLKANSLITFHENGKIESGNLSEETQIQGMVFHDEIEFYQNGKVKRGQLGQKILINYKEYDRNRTVELDEKGKYIR
jgi:hypothetical protein